MKLPDRIFFTGAPGSMWSGIAQDLETGLKLNISDRTPERCYKHQQYTGHKGSYFGEGMEFTANINTMSETEASALVDSPWETLDGTRIVKSHEWMFKIDTIKQYFPNDWFMMVYRPDMACYDWWHEAGGFRISYPSYASYKTSELMLASIIEQNRAMMEISDKYKIEWHKYTPQWVKQEFGTEITCKPRADDILVAIIK